MLILFETPAGFALFKANDKKLAKVDAANIFESFFATPELAQEKCVRLAVPRRACRTVFTSVAVAGGPAQRCVVPAAVWAGQAASARGLALLGRSHTP